MLPALQIAHPAAPVPLGSKVSVWRNPATQLQIDVYQAEGRHWIRLPDVAIFGFAESGGVTAIPLPGTTPAGIRLAYMHLILPLVLQTRGVEVLHASAVRLPQGVLALCADSETGKSTLAYALHQRGYPQWADDTLAWQPAAAGIVALPLPFRSSLRPTAHAYFAADSGAGDPGHAALRRPRLRRPARAPVPLAGLCVLARLPDGSDPPCVVRRLAGPAAFRAVLAQGRVFNLGEIAEQRATLERYLTLAAQVPVWDVRFRAGLDGVPALLDALLAAVCA